MSQLVSNKGNVNRITMQIEVRGNKKVDVNRNNVNRGGAIRGITINKNITTTSV